MTKVAQFLLEALYSSQWLLGKGGEFHTHIRVVGRAFVSSEYGYRTKYDHKSLSGIACWYVIQLTDDQRPIARSTDRKIEKGSVVDYALLRSPMQR